MFRFSTLKYNLETHSFFESSDKFISELCFIARIATETLKI